MGKETQPRSTEEIFASAVPNSTSLRVAVNRTLASGSLNPITVGNQAIIAKKKRMILYKNGYTLPGKAAALLAAEAVSSIQHSGKLGGNIRKSNSGGARPSETDAHHVVASGASGAHASRVLIFSVGIGINDADNGVILPRNPRHPAVDFSSFGKRSVRLRRVTHERLELERRTQRIHDLAADARGGLIQWNIHRRRHVQDIERAPESDARHRARREEAAAAR